MNAPADPDFAPRIRESFSRRKARALIGASLAVVEPGYVAARWSPSTVARGEVYPRDGKHVATMQQTLTMLAGIPDTTQ